MAERGTPAIRGSGSTLFLRATSHSQIDRTLGSPNLFGNPLAPMNGGERGQGVRGHRKAPSHSWGYCMVGRVGHPRSNV